LTDNKWKQAMDLRMEALEKNSTWGLVILPNGKKKNSRMQMGIYY